MVARKPNLLFVFADQLRLQSCGYASDSRVRTPHMDSLAAQGVDFHQAVVSMPVCSAMRASLFTGKYVTSTGMVINELRLNPAHHPQCLGHCLSQGGYRTGYIGKWHLYANELGNHHDPKNSFVPPGPDRLGFDEYWAAYNFHHEYYDAYYHEDTPEKISCGEGVYEPDGQTDMAIRFLAGQKDEPFALFVSFGTPHDPWIQTNVPPQHYEMFKNTAFTPPLNYRQEMDAPYGDAWSDMDKDPKKLDEWMRVYYAIYRVDGKELLFDHQNDPLQRRDLAGNKDCERLLACYRSKCQDKMAALNDTFPVSSWYRENWISPDRIILQTATSPRVQSG